MNRTRKGMDLAAAVVVGLMAAAALCAMISEFDDCEPEAYACDGVCAIAAAIRRLQPATSEERADALAPHFVEAGRESDIDPLLLVALAMRESSLHPAVENLTKRGSRGELGLLQVHPAGPALRLRPRECPETLDGARCQLRTGARFLAFVRDHCAGSTWRWVAAYGRSRCPSESEARADRNAAIAASYYARAGGTAW